MKQARTYGSVAINNGNFELDMEPQVRLRFKRAFERVSKAHAGAIQLATTPLNARELDWFMERYPLVVPDRVRRRIVDLKWQHERREQDLYRMSQPDYVPGEYELALPLREYQTLAVDLAVTSGNLLIGDDVGLGKTPQGIAVFSEPLARPALVVTLSHLPTQWGEQIEKFLPGMRVHILRGVKPYDLEQNQHGNAMPFPDVIVTNYHKLASWAETLAGVVKTVVYDEIQELRRAESQKYAAAQLISDLATYQIGLTATPIYNYGIEIFNILNAMSPGCLGAREEFCREWCGGQTGAKAAILEPRAFGKFLRDEGLMIRRTRKEVGRELPVCSVNTHFVEPEQFHLQKISQEVAELAKLLLKETGSGLDKMKAAGEMDYRLRRATGMSKAGAVAAFVKLMLEAGEKVVLWGWHRDVYDIWKDQLAEYDPGWITGSETAVKKELHKQRFLKGPDQVLMKSHGAAEDRWVKCKRRELDDRYVKCRGTNLLIMSLRSGAGIDGLQDVCSVGVIGELDWSPGVHTQCIGRIHRDGQESPVMIYAILTNEGSDPVMADVCQIKKMQLDGINDPDADDLVEEAQVDVDRMKTLAREYLKRQGQEPSDDEPAPVPEEIQKPAHADLYSCSSA